MKVADILERAADAIETRGHHKGWYCGPDGSLCVHGGMYVAVGVEPESRGSGDDWLDGAAAQQHLLRPAELLLADHLGWDSLTEWNDAPERTREGVVSTLRAAARAEQ